jgi:hypothetical protein
MKKENTRYFDKIELGNQAFRKLWKDSEYHKLFYKKPQYFAIWKYLICITSHTDTDIVKRGQCKTSYREIMKQVKVKFDIDITLQMIRTLVKKLESDKMILINKSKTGSVITLINFDKYQDKNTQNNIKQQYNKNKEFFMNGMENNTPNNTQITHPQHKNNTPNNTPNNTQITHPQHKNNTQNNTYFNTLIIQILQQQTAILQAIQENNKITQDLLKEMFLSKNNTQNNTPNNLNNTQITHQQHTDNTPAYKEHVRDRDNIENIDNTLTPPSNNKLSNENQNLNQQENQTNKPQDFETNKNQKKCEVQVNFSQENEKGFNNPTQPQETYQPQETSQQPQDNEDNEDLSIDRKAVEEFAKDNILSKFFQVYGKESLSFDSIKSNQEFLNVYSDSTQVLSNVNTQRFFNTGTCFMKDEYNFNTGEILSFYRWRLSQKQKYYDENKEAKQSFLSFDKSFCLLKDVKYIDIWQSQGKPKSHLESIEEDNLNKESREQQKQLNEKEEIERILDGKLINSYDNSINSFIDRLNNSLPNLRNTYRIVGTGNKTIFVYEESILGRSKIERLFEKWKQHYESDYNIAFFKTELLFDYLENNTQNNTQNSLNNTHAKNNTDATHVIVAKENNEFKAMLDSF